MLSSPFRRSGVCRGKERCRARQRRKLRVPQAVRFSVFISHTSCKERFVKRGEYRSLVATFSGSVNIVKNLHGSVRRCNRSVRPVYAEIRPAFPHSRGTALLSSEAPFRLQEISFRAFVFHPFFSGAVKRRPRRFLFSSNILLAYEKNC